MELYCKTIDAKPGWRELTKIFTYKDVEVPVGFQWNGANPEKFTEGKWWQRWLGKAVNWVVPRYARTLKASCIHDFVSKKAKTKKEQSKGDIYFKELTEVDGLSRGAVKAGYYGISLGTIAKYGFGK